MVTRVTYDMQKLDEAVSALAAGTDRIQERLRAALIPMLVLKSGGGMHNVKRSGELNRILDGLSHESIGAMTDEQAREKARAIVNLQSGNWHDAVWALEDEFNERS